MACLEWISSALAAAEAEVTDLERLCDCQMFEGWSKCQVVFAFHREIYLSC